SSAEQEWLFEPHSLTAKLKSQSQRFAVKVLSEQKVNLSQPQQALLSNEVNTVLNREVLLLCDDKPVVYAQSWLPISNNNTNNQLHN
ncbi:chorismate lyase, partial [Pseudoalteromonas sp. 41-MNA-CIBAN-0057]